MGDALKLEMSSKVQDDLYWAIGKCVWHVQYLEDVLHSYLTLKIEIRERARVSKAEALQLLAKHRRATLGTALGIAEKHSALPAELVTDLRALKDERDWLVHRSMHQDSYKLKSKEGQKEFFGRLADFLEATVEIKARLFFETKAFCESHGISVEAIDGHISNPQNSTASEA